MASSPQLLAVYGGDQQPLAHYLLGPNRLAVQDRSGNVVWFLEDHLQSVRLLTDAAGKVCGAAEYTAFGHADGLPAGATNFGFTGEWRDPDTGLIFLRARWYDPEVGRFISPDPLWGALERPASLNRYAYVENNPVNGVDPTGLAQLPPPPPPPSRPWEGLPRTTPLPVFPFPGTSRPADFLRTPDYYVVNVNVFGVNQALRQLGRLEAGAGVGGAIVIDRFGNFHDVYTGGAGVTVGTDRRLKAGAYWILGPAPRTSQEIKQFIAGLDFSLHAHVGEYVHSGGKHALGLVTPGYSVSASGAVVGADLRANLGQLLEKLRPTQQHGVPDHFTGASARDLAQVLARNPYKLYSREHGEAKAADLYERLARSNPLNHQKVWTDWVMGAEYTSIDEIQGTRGALAPPTQLGGGGGRGWQLLVPEVRLRGTGKETTVHLTDAWHSFERPVTAPSFREVRSTGQGQVLLTGADGSVWEFGSHRKLTRYRLGDTEWTHTYERDRLLRVTVRKDGRVTAQFELTYNPSGQVSAVTDQAGRTVNYEYDARGRLVEVRAGDQSIRYGYNDSHQLNSVQDGAARSSFEYTPEGYLTRGPGAGGQAVQYQREATPEGGTRIRTSGPQGHEVVLDPQGRLGQVTRGDLTARRREEKGEVTRELLAGGQVVARVRQTADGRRLEVEYPGERREVYERNPDGTVARGKVEAGKQTAEVHFDARGNPVRVTDPAGGVYGESTPAPGRREIVTPAGIISVQTDGRRVRLRTPSGREFTWGHGDDHAPNRVTESDAAGQREWARSAAGTWERKEGGKVRTRVQTDAAGRVTEITDVAGVKTQARHGEGGTVVRTGTGKQFVVRRDAAGRVLEAREYPADAPPAAVPLPDLTGRRTVQEKVEKLPPVKKH